MTDPIAYEHLKRKTEYKVNTKKQRIRSLIFAAIMISFDSLIFIGNSDADGFVIMVTLFGFLSIIAFLFVKSAFSKPNTCEYGIVTSVNKKQRQIVSDTERAGVERI